MKASASSNPTASASSPSLSRGLAVCILRSNTEKYGRKRLAACQSRLIGYVANQTFFFIRIRRSGIGAGPSEGGAVAAYAEITLLRIGQRRIESCVSIRALRQTFDPHTLNLDPPATASVHAACWTLSGNARQFHGSTRCMTRTLLIPEKAWRNLTTISSNCIYLNRSRFEEIQPHSRSMC